MNVPGAGPGKNGELLFREDRVACGENERVLEMDGAMVAQPCKCLISPNSTLQDT